MAIRKIPQNDNIPPRLVQAKLFRKVENDAKIAFILANTSIPSYILMRAQDVSGDNRYHNFGHQLGVAESAILIAQAQGLPIQDITLLVLVGLFHDAGHTGVPKPDDEENACKLVRNALNKEELSSLGCSQQDIERLILATKFSQRGICNDVLEQIIQDADLGVLGRGPYYMLYTIMGLIDEEHLSVYEYVLQEQKFLDSVKLIHPDIFLSMGARKIYSNPQSTLNTIASRPVEVISFAYEKRYEDISYVDFCSGINAILCR